MRNLFLILYLALASVSYAASVGNAYVPYEPGTGKLKTNLEVPSGKTVKIGSGGKFHFAADALFEGDAAAFRTAIGTGSAAWSDLTGKPSTLSGFGISDGLTATAINSYFASPSANGSFSAGNWRSGLGLVIGTNVQAYDADLATFAAITPSGNIISLLNAANYDAVRTLLGLAIGTNVQAFDTDLSIYAGITPSANVQTLLGSLNYSAFRASLGLALGTDVQAFDEDLTALAALSGTNTLYYRSASNAWTAVTIGDNLTFSGGTLSATGGSGTGDASTNTTSSVDTEVAVFSGTSGKTLKRATTTGIAKMTSGVISAATAGTDYLAPAAIGTTVQAYDADLATFAGISPSANIQTLLATANYAAARTALGVGIGLNVQAWDADLDSWAAIAPTAKANLTGGNTWTGIQASEGAQVSTANAMGALVIDVTKDLNTKSVSASTTFTFSGTPASSNTWFSLRVKNTDSTARTITIPSTFDTNTQSTVTSFTILPGGTETITWCYDGTVYNGYGIPSSNFATDAGASDTYAISFAPALTTYATGASYRFKANTANTGAATININSLGAKSIVKVAGGVTTALADNDIRAGQIVDLVYDGTNMQIQSTLGNAASGGGGTDSNAIHGNASGEIDAITSKTTPTTSDLLLIEDAAASNAKKKVTAGALPISTATQTALDAKASISYVDSEISAIDAGTGVPTGGMILWPTASLGSIPTGFLEADGTEGTEDMDAIGTGTWIQRTTGVAPTLSSLTIPTGGDTIVGVFDEAVEFGAGGSGGLDLTLTGGAVAATYSTGEGTDTITWGLDRIVIDTETGTADYTQPGNGIEDLIGNDLASDTGIAIVNDSAETAGGAPEWGGEVASRYYELSNSATTDITTTADVLVGERIVLVISTYLQPGQSVSSVADTHGNSYNVDVSQTYETSRRTFIASAYVGTQITSGDVVTITWGSPANNYRWAMVGKITDAASGAKDSSATGTAGSGTTPSATASTVATNTACVGVITLNDQAKTYGSSNWTMIGAVYDPGASTERSYYFYKNNVAAGSQNPGGTLSSSEAWGMAWAAYK